MRYLVLLVIAFTLATHVPVSAEPACRFLTPRDATTIAYASKGTLVAIGFQKGQVKLYDAHTGQLTCCIATGEKVLSLAFTTNGQTVITGGSGGQLGFWNAKTGSLEQQENLSTPVSLLAMSEDGKRLAVGNEPNSVKLWSPGRAWQCVLHIVPIDAVVRSIGFLGGSQYLFVAGSSKEINIYETDVGLRRFTVGASTVVEAVAVAPDNGELAIAGWLKKVIIYRFKGKQFANLETGVAINALAYGQSGELAIGGENRLILLTDRRFIGPHAVFVHHAPHGAITKLCFSPDGRKVLSLSEKGAVYLWDTSFATPLRQ